MFQFQEILWPIVILGGLGLIFGLGLAFASKKFAVARDPKIDQVRELLPGANCGGCGYPGCDGCASAIAQGEAEVSACPVGGSALAGRIAEVMGVQAEAGERRVAYVQCQGGENCHDKMRYQGLSSCAAAMLAAGGPKACSFGCMGLGDCVKACPFGAITINQAGVAQVDPDKCQSCGKCLGACPKRIIRMVPESRQALISCRSLQRGRLVKVNCDNGCIGCGLCARACKFGAITMQDNLPVTDYSKCVNCQKCVEACPTHAMHGDLSRRKLARIDAEHCVGCTLCAKKCPFEAIDGELKRPHVVDPEKCAGCGVCAETCRKDAITLVDRKRGEA